MWVCEPRTGPTTRSSVRSKSSADIKYVTRASLVKTSFNDLLKGKMFGKTARNVSFDDESSKLAMDKREEAGRRKSRPERNLKNLSIVSDEGYSASDLSFSPSGLIAEIPALLARPRHPLKQAWTLWYFRNDRSLSWEENQQAVATVGTVEEFWQLHQLLQPASQLGQGSSYAVFRAGVLPDWEDPANIAGGRWIARRNRAELDEAWLELIFYAIGEHADSQAGQVTGVVAAVRRKGDKVAVWLKDARNMVAVVDVGRQVRSRLGLQPEVKVQFSVHREEMDWTEGGGERQQPILL